MSLTTPDKIRNLQRKLYCKAKAEPTFRFYLLYDKICREDILVHAYRLARVNAGAPGVDGMTFARIEEQGLEAWLAGLRAELVSKTYRPDPVRRVMIPKPRQKHDRPERDDCPEATSANAATSSWRITTAPRNASTVNVAMS